MGTLLENKSAASVLFGKTRLAILSLLLLQQERSFYVREIIELIGMGRGNVQRELNHLAEAGILTRKRIGNQVHYKANEASPIFPELKSLLVKTSGVADVIKDALLTLGHKVDFAFIFGSFAVGDFSSESDVDLMVVGSAGFREVVSTLLSAQESLGREINPSVHSTKAFRRKLKEKEHFISDVIGKPKIMIIGNADDIE